jgi:hypothetical protein
VIKIISSTMGMEKFQRCDHSSYVGTAKLNRATTATWRTPRSTCRHEMRQIQLDAYVSNRGEPVKRDLGMSEVRIHTAHGHARSGAHERPRLK